MSLFLSLTTLISILFVAGLLLVRAIQNHTWRIFTAEIGSLLLFVFFLHALFDFPFPRTVQAKGNTDELLLVSALFLCMLLGMFSQFLFRTFQQPKSARGKWDWGLFVAPVFASPIVFIPLLAAFQSANISLENLTEPRLMIFFVAYQNGFFWKEFFDRKQSEEKDQRS